MGTKESCPYGGLTKESSLSSCITILFLKYENIIEICLEVTKPKYIIHTK